MTQPAQWVGPVGDAWAAEWQRTDRSLAGLAIHLDASVRDAATPDKTVAIDIGCGAGATSIALATARPDLRVAGVDLSPELITVARDRSTIIPNLKFTVGAVEAVVAQRAPVDLFVSRHGVMFFPDPVAAFRALRAAAAPGARLVFSCFRAPTLNRWAADVAGAIIGAAPPPPPPGYTPGPFAFADRAFVEQVLVQSGWHADDAVPIDFAYRAGTGADPVADALSFFTRIGPAAPLLRAAAPEDRSAMLSRLAVVAEQYRNADVVEFPAAAWLWSAHA